MSDAVDRSVSEIDFRPLTGRKVFLDTKYATSGKTTSMVNADYIISSVRQQMLAADCRLMDAADGAELIAELRIGTLGTDANDVVYGIPASNAVSGAASLVPNAPIVPPIPEISVARREAQLGAAKIALFAYDRETRRPVWQSGIKRARSTAQDFWVLGAGPFQRGSNVDGTQFAGTELWIPHPRDDGTFDESPPVNYDQEYVFQAPAGIAAPALVNVAGFVDRVAAEPASSAPTADAPANAEGKPQGGTAPAPAPSDQTPPAAAPTANPESAAAAPTPPPAGTAAATPEEAATPSLPAATKTPPAGAIRVTDQAP